jgi:WD repeat-containing protein 35
VESMVEPDRPVNPVGAALFDVLKLSQLMKDTSTRVRDMKKLTEGAALELNNLSQMTDVINTKQLEDVFRSVEANTKFLVDASAANERACASLEIMQVVLAGSFAFDIIDRLGGGTLNVEPPEWLNTYITVPLIESVPFLWFGINILFLVIFCYVLIRVMRWSEYKASGILMIRVKVNCSINLQPLETYLATKPIELTDSISEPEIDIKKVIWTEKDHNLWMGSAPKIELLYDERHFFLLSVFMQVDKKRMKISQDSLLRMFYRELLAHGVIIEIPEAKKDKEES